MLMACKIKICGLTNRDDMDLVANSGADYGGVLVEIDSVRALSLEDAKTLCLDPPLPIVIVTLDRDESKNRQITEAIDPTALQLHGAESPELVKALKQQIPCEIWKVIHLPSGESGEGVDTEALLARMNEYTEAGADRILVDATIMKQGKRHLGGTGKTVDWETARILCERSNVPFIVAGGLHPGNVAEAVTRVHPYAVDLSSGVEAEKGKKSPQKVIELIDRVRKVESL